MMQGEGIRGPRFVPQGGTIRVDVGPNDTTVEVSSPGGGGVTGYPVTPNKTARIPVPDVPPGTVLHVTIGKGNRLRVLVVLVTAA